MRGRVSSRRTLWHRPPPLCARTGPWRRSAKGGGGREAGEGGYSVAAEDPPRRSHSAWRPDRATPPSVPRSTAPPPDHRLWRSPLGSAGSSPRGLARRALTALPVVVDALVLGVSPLASTPPPVRRARGRPRARARAAAHARAAERARRGARARAPATRATHAGSAARPAHVSASTSSRTPGWGVRGRSGGRSYPERPREREARGRPHVLGAGPRPPCAASARAAARTRRRASRRPPRRPAARRRWSRARRRRGGEAPRPRASIAARYSRMRRATAAWSAASAADARATTRGATRLASSPGSVARWYLTRRREGAVRSETFCEGGATTHSSTPQPSRIRCVLEEGGGRARGLSFIREGPGLAARCRPPPAVDRVILGVVEER